MISNDAILSPSRLKKYRRSTGLPEKLPTRWLVTTVFPSFSSHAKGSLVYSYFAEASVFHSLIAARPIRATQGNTAQHVHQLLPGHCEVAFVFVRHALNHSRSGIGFNEAGRNGNDAN